jgi:NAD(P)-dependent dehydrogenase (short-subunit alcohol dehydrogenase family)
VSEDRDLLGARALVTGAGGGIGQAIAVELARRGATVAVHTAASDPQQTLEAIASIGGRAVAVRGDLRDPAVCGRRWPRPQTSLAG